MALLPADIKEVFFNTVYGGIGILEFEQWLYHNKEIENVLSAESYLDLIAYGYKEQGAMTGLMLLLYKQIKIAEYEHWKLRKMLVSVLEKEPATAETLLQFYDMYCSGYVFLRVLALDYGLKVGVPHSCYDTKSWNDEWGDLETAQQEEIINSFYPAIKEEASLLINWLDTGKIVITEKKDPFDHLTRYTFDDHRNQAERAYVK